MHISKKIALLIAFLAIVGAGIWLGIRKGGQGAPTATRTPIAEPAAWCKQWMNDAQAAQLTGWNLQGPIEITQEPLLTDNGKANCVVRINTSSDTFVVLTLVPLYTADDRKKFSAALSTSREELKKIRPVSSLGLGTDSYYANGEQGLLASSINASAYTIVFGMVQNTPDVSVQALVKRLMQYGFTHTPPLSDGASILPRGVVFFNDVQFTSQAPNGDWDDQRQQDGCEEASSLMAIRWANRQSLTSSEALEEILAVSDYEQATYGNYHDTNAQDTVERIIKGYFQYTKATAQSDIGVADIKEELYKGRLVLVPVQGQKLNNPNFSGEGPERHMIVIIGYDPKTDQFTTNDPGTRKGKGYRYSSTTIQNALFDYPTGDHVPATGPLKTAMIVVER